MSVSPARRAALGALAEIRRRGAYSRPVVDAYIGSADLSAADFAFAARLAYGVVLAEGVLDDIINDHAKRPGAVEPRVRDAMRLSIYELLYLSTPARAAVHQGVEAVRKARPAAAGFANAVLRQIADRASSFPWGDPTSDRDALARASAMPGWLVDTFLADLGGEHGRTALLAGIDAAPLFVRSNPFFASPSATFDALVADGAAPESSPPDASSMKCCDAAAAVHGRAISHGLAIVSDAAAQVAPLACDPRPGERVLDVGAGLGTKSAMLQGVANSHGGVSDITAVDIHAFKLDRLMETMDRLGVRGVRTCVVDASGPETISEAGRDYDVALLDAPCTGLGTLRRHPEKRWRLTPEDVDRIAALQSRMLSATASVVRPGGRVVYSTCTITRAENEDVVDAFLASEQGSEFAAEALEGLVPAEWERFITSDGFFRSWPEKDGPDGHFVAVLRRFDH